MKVLDLKDDFGPHCVGRYPSSGPQCGENLRNLIMLKLADGDDLIINVNAYVHASFLEEAFGGLIRAGLSYEDFDSRVFIRTDDDRLKKEILDYVKDAEWRKT